MEKGMYYYGGGWSCLWEIEFVVFVSGKTDALFD